jgi:histidinol-phosphate aminotransferase
LKKKKILVEKYKELGIDVIDGVANFILLNFSSISDIEYENLKDFLISKKVYLRDVADYGLPQHLRLSIGSKENNRVALDKIAEFFKKKSNG